MQLSDERIKELKVAHVCAKDDYTFFIRYFFKAQYGRKWQQWPHLLEIARTLQDVLDGKVTRLIINIAPRLGKTDVAVKFFIGAGLAINAAAKFIHLSYSDDLALDNSEAAKDVVTSEDYQLMFSDVRIKKDSTAKKKWYTTKGGGVYATSTGGQITGFGAGQVDLEEGEAETMQLEDPEMAAFFVDDNGDELFGGAIIIDDPNKPEDADSELLRTRVNERFDSTIRNRVNSRKTPIIILQQRTHELDLSGYVISKEPGVWTVISMPSIKENGEALCPEKYTIEELRELERINDIVFQRQHMQNPKPRAGLLFPDVDLHYYSPKKMEKALDDPDYTYVCADPAGEGGDDFAAAPFILVGDKIYVTDMIYNTKGADYNEVRLKELVLSVNAKSVGVEAVFGWIETARRVRESLVKAGFKNEFRSLHPRKSKHSRILNRSSFIRNNFVFPDDWKDRPEFAKFMRSLISYKRIQEAGSKNKHDDAADLCEMAAVYYERNFTHLWQIKDA